MMKGIAQKFVKYVMHVQVVRKEEPAPVVQNVQQISSDTVPTDGILAAARSAAATGEVDTAALAQVSQARAQEAPAKQQTVVRDEWSKTPRNAPCPCGSGKKFKQCHGTTV